MSWLRVHATFFCADAGKATAEDVRAKLILMENWSAVDSAKSKIVEAIEDIDSVKFKAFAEEIAAALLPPTRSVPPPIGLASYAVRFPF